MSGIFCETVYIFGIHDLTFAHHYNFYLVALTIEGSLYRTDKIFTVRRFWDEKGLFADKIWCFAMVKKSKR